MRSIRSRPTASPSSVRRSSERAANASLRFGSGQLDDRAPLHRRQRHLLEPVELAGQLALLEVRVERGHRLLPHERRARVRQQQRARDDQRGREPAQRGAPVASGVQRVRSSPQRRLRAAERARAGVGDAGRGWRTACRPPPSRARSGGARAARARRRPAPPAARRTAASSRRPTRSWPRAPSPHTSSQRAEVEREAEVHEREDGRRAGRATARPPPSTRASRRRRTATGARRGPAGRRRRGCAPTRAPPARTATPRSRRRALPRRARRARGDRSAISSALGREPIARASARAPNQRQRRRRRPRSTTRDDPARPGRPAARVEEPGGRVDQRRSRASARSHSHATGSGTAATASQPIQGAIGTRRRRARKNASSAASSTGSSSAPTSSRTLQSAITLRSVTMPFGASANAGASRRPGGVDARRPRAPPSARRRRRRLRVDGRVGAPVRARRTPRSAPRAALRRRSAPCSDSVTGSARRTHWPTARGPPASARVSRRTAACTVRSRPSGGGARTYPSTTPPTACRAGCPPCRRARSRRPPGRPPPRAPTRARPRSRCVAPVVETSTSVLSRSRDLNTRPSSSSTAVAESSALPGASRLASTTIRRSDAPGRVAITVCRPFSVRGPLDA